MGLFCDQIRHRLLTEQSSTIGSGRIDVGAQADFSTFSSRRNCSTIGPLGYFSARAAALHNLANSIADDRNHFAVLRNACSEEKQQRLPLCWIVLHCVSQKCKRNKKQRLNCLFVLVNVLLRKRILARTDTTQPSSTECMSCHRKPTNMTD